MTLVLLKVGGAWEETDAETLSQARRDGAASVTLPLRGRGLIALYEVTGIGPSEIRQVGDRSFFEKLTIRQGSEREGVADFEVTLVEPLDARMAAAYAEAVKVSGIALIAASSMPVFKEDHRTRVYPGSPGAAEIGLART